QGSSNITQDLYFRLMNPNASAKNMMFAARLSVVIIAALALMVSYFMTDIVSMYQWALRLSATVLVFPFLAIMLWRKTTSKGIVASMIAAGLITIIWPFLGISIDAVIPDFIASFVVLIVVSLITKHSLSETVKAVLWEDLPSATRNMDQQEAEEKEVVGASTIIAKNNTGSI